MTFDQRFAYASVYGPASEIQRFKENFETSLIFQSPACLTRMLIPELYTGTKWSGSYVRVEKAKTSYIEKLEQEWKTEFEKKEQRDKAREKKTAVLSRRLKEMIVADRSVKGGEEGTKPVAKKQQQKILDAPPPADEKEKEKKAKQQAGDHKAAKKLLPQEEEEEEEEDETPSGTSREYFFQALPDKGSSEMEQTG
eukprot:756425-Hanusia_phi.AAC.2